MGRWLDRVEKKLDLNMVDHEARLRHVERWLYSIPASVLVGLASIAGALLVR
jgi:hypothetical protein